MKQSILVESLQKQCREAAESTGVSIVSADLKQVTLLILGTGEVATIRWDNVATSQYIEQSLRGRLLRIKELSESESLYLDRNYRNQEIIRRDFRLVRCAEQKNELIGDLADQLREGYPLVRAQFTEVRLLLYPEEKDERVSHLNGEQRAKKAVDRSLDWIYENTMTVSLLDKSGRTSVPELVWEEKQFILQYLKKHQNMSVSLLDITWLMMMDKYLPKRFFYLTGKPAIYFNVLVFLKNLEKQAYLFEQHHSKQDAVFFVDANIRHH
ncbi:hypothetical protein [Listeria booriae]|uniref:hypothetical protein n=1 Tax=Listeria booriae TaxID=1552123 RepID=UPI00164DE0DD|nr:hypothetical protein [Listeria booriae]MBC6301567.1 hypothetical protein [Listeria booriae]